MTFGVTPVAGFPPPPTSDQFPGGIQWQLDGTDVGDRTIDTVSFVEGAEIGMEVDPDDERRLVITIPTSGGGSAVPNLVLSLFANSFFDAGSDITAWEVDTLQESADAAWSQDDGGILMSSAGLYRVSITARITANSELWPTDALGGTMVTKYGTQCGGSVTSIGGMERSLHVRPAEDLGPIVQDDNPGFVQWTDEYVIQATEENNYVIVGAHVSHYLGGEDGLSVDATVTVTKL